MPNWPGTNDAPCCMVSARSALADVTSETTSVAVSLAAFGSGPAPETKLRPAGSMSVTVVGPGVAVGPLLPTTMLKMPVPPAVNAPGCESAIAMSALGAVGDGGAIAASGLYGAT